MIEEVQRSTALQGRVCREPGARDCALSPRGRGQRWTINKHDWVRACGLTPHPIFALNGRAALSRKGRGRNDKRRAFGSAVGEIPYL
jgi:hypothetical protein